MNSCDGDYELPPACPRGCGMSVEGDDHTAKCSNRELDPKVLTDTVLGGDFTPMTLAAVIKKAVSDDFYPPERLERFFGIVKDTPFEGRLVFGSWISFRKCDAPIDADCNRHVSEPVIAAALLRGNLKSSFEKWIDNTPFTFMSRERYAMYGTSAYIKDLKKKKVTSECWMVPRIVAADAASAAGHQETLPGVRCAHCATDQAMCLQFWGGLKRCTGQGCSRNRSSAVMYCGRDCQMIDWKVHKRVCKNNTAGDSSRRMFV